MDWTKLANMLRMRANMAAGMNPQQARANAYPAMKGPGVSTASTPAASPVPNSTPNGTKLARIWGAQRPDPNYLGNIFRNRRLRKDELRYYYEDKAKEDPSDATKATLVGGGLGAAVGAGLGLAMNPHKALRAAVAGTLLGGGAGAMLGAGTAAADRRSIEHAKAVLEDPDLDAELERQISQEELRRMMSRLEESAERHRREMFDHRDHWDSFKMAAAEEAAGELLFRARLCSG